MTTYEYRVIPAPTKGRKAQGVKGAEARFAHTLQDVMNEQAAEGWEYQRSDILPSEERQGLTSSHTVYRSVLVFRRAADDLDESEKTAPNTEGEIEENGDLSEPYKENADESAAENSPPERP
ncbi:hypothetical protein FDP25_02865 [Roseovarius sp. A21]|uniref:DUF4177 domain-containing protein n=1 Tax=Roseovarius bejariae TaxID=2576383 RepID=A0A844CLL8_9RHOB|nr:DUF4177 domain-containing protein [Roseovarius bejariae]MRU14365.1 hypothetical protein [Roseovarius bejariae]